MGSILFTVFFYYLLGIIHALKIKFLGSPLFVSDFFPAGLHTALGVLPGLNFFYPATILFIVSLFLMSYLLYIGKFRIIKINSNFEASFPIRLLLFILFSSVLFTYVMGSNKIEIEMIRFFRLTKLDRNNEEFFRAQGLGAGLLFNLRAIVQKEKPKDYKESLIEVFRRKYVIEEDVHKKDFNPNIIVFLAETFWDPLSYNLEVSPDPIPFFRSQQGKTGGIVHLPVTGGGTVISEFEVLTGFSSQFIWGFPYISGIYRRVPSLASFFAKKNYRTVFLHGYHGWFYDRERVLPLLGFQEFFYDKHIIAEHSPKEIEDFRYIRDEFFMESLMREARKEKPFFLFASNYGTHGPFNYEEDKGIYKVSNQLSEKAKKNLIGNLQLLNLFDRALEKLFKELEKTDNPTFVIVFGDHIPTEAYLGFSPGNYAKNEYQIYTCPYFVWANYPIEKFPDELSINFIPHNILKNSGIGLEYQFRYLNELEKKVKIFSYYKQIEKGAKEKNLPPNFQEWMEDYKLMQYDLLYGNQYLLE